MEDSQFVETVLAAIGAAQSFLDTEAAYGPDDPRTKREKERLAETITALTPSNVDVPELHLVVQESPEEIDVGTVVRSLKWGAENTGTVVRREGDSLFVAWHNSFVEDELDISEVEVWADAPQHIRDWRGGVGVWDPAQPERWSIRPVEGPEPQWLEKEREEVQRRRPIPPRDGWDHER